MRRMLLKIMAVSLMFAGSFAFADALDAVVVSSTGKVEVQNGTQWVSVKEGDVLKKGSVVQTGFKSELVLKVKESNMKISQLTRMVIENLSAGSDKDDTRIFIDTGSVFENNTADSGPGGAIYTDSQKSWFYCSFACCNRFCSRYNCKTFK